MPRNPTMDDEFTIASDAWALAARLLDQACEHDEDNWELEIQEGHVFEMTFHRMGGSASSRVVLMDYDVNRDAYDRRDAGDVYREIQWVAEQLPELAEKASLV